MPDPFNFTHREDRTDCLHCSIIELVDLSGRCEEEVLASLLQVVADRAMRKLTSTGSDDEQSEAYHDYFGEVVRTLSYAFAYYWAAYGGRNDSTTRTSPYSPTDPA